MQSFLYREQQAKLLPNELHAPQRAQDMTGVAPATGTSGIVYNACVTSTHQILLVCISEQTVSFALDGMQRVIRRLEAAPSDPNTKQILINVVHRHLQPHAVAPCAVVPLNLVFVRDESKQR